MRGMQSEKIIEIFPCTISKQTQDCVRSPLTKLMIRLKDTKEALFFDRNLFTAVNINFLGIIFVFPYIGLYVLPYITYKNEYLIDYLVNSVMYISYSTDYYSHYIPTKINSF